MRTRTRDPGTKRPCGLATTPRTWMVPVRVIDAVIGKIQHTFVREAVVAVETEVEGKLGAGAPVFCRALSCLVFMIALQRALIDIEIEKNRDRSTQWSLKPDHYRRRYQIADRQLRSADPAADRRGNPRVFDIQLLCA